MAEVDHTAVLRHAGGVREAVSPDGRLMLHAHDRSGVHLLDGPAALVWGVLGTPCTLRDCADEIAALTGTDASAIVADCQPLLADLRARGLLVVGDEPAAPDLLGPIWPSKPNPRVLPVRLDPCLQAFNRATWVGPLLWEVNDSLVGVRASDADTLQAVAGDAVSPPAGLDLPPNVTVIRGKDTDDVHLVYERCKAVGRTRDLTELAQLAREQAEQVSWGLRTDAAVLSAAVIHDGQRAILANQQYRPMLLGRERQLSQHGLRLGPVSYLIDAAGTLSSPLEPTPLTVSAWLGGRVEDRTTFVAELVADLRNLERYPLQDAVDAVSAAMAGALWLPRLTTSGWSDLITTVASHFDS